MLYEFPLKTAAAATVSLERDIYKRVKNDHMLSQSSE